MKRIITLLFALVLILASVQANASAPVKQDAKKEVRDIKPKVKKAYTFNYIWNMSEQEYCGDTGHWRWCTVTYSMEWGVISEIGRSCNPCN